MKNYFYDPNNSFAEGFAKFTMFKECCPSFFPEKEDRSETRRQQLKDLYGMLTNEADKNIFVSKNGTWWM